MAKRGGFPGGGMPGNMANLMKLLEELRLSPLNEALEKVDAHSLYAMSKFTGGRGGLGGGMPGLF